MHSIDATVHLSETGPEDPQAIPRKIAGGIRH